MCARAVAYMLVQRVKLENSRLFLPIVQTVFYGFDLKLIRCYPKKIFLSQSKLSIER
jgi:hypothetical protein